MSANGSREQCMKVKVYRGISLQTRSKIDQECKLIVWAQEATKVHKRHKWQNRSLV